MADEENGSGTDCCIVYERILNAANKNDGDSIGYCEPTSAVDDDDDNDDDDDSDVISIWYDHFGFDLFGENIKYWSWQW